MRFLVPTLLMAGCCLLAACDFAGTTASDRPLIGTTWHLIAFEEATGNSESISVRPDFADVAYTVTLTTQPAVGGMYDGPAGTHRTRTIGYPNQGLFTYQHGDSRTLSLFFHGATKINQLPGSKETLFFQALDTAVTYQIKGDRMRLTYDSGKALLFEAKASASD